MSPESKRIIPPEELLEGYKSGYFPMSESRDDPGFEWYGAKERGVIPIDKFRVSKNVERVIRQGKFECRVNTCFREVIEACAGREDTWISDLIIDSFEVFHILGYAHSVEIFDSENNIAGGLYGVSVGAAFFGESMFKRTPDADKVAMWHCHKILKENRYLLWDTQFYTKHLARFGCERMSPEEYHLQLQNALFREAEFKL